MIRKGIQVVLLGIGSWLLISLLVCAFSGCSEKGTEALRDRAIESAAAGTKVTPEAVTYQLPWGRRVVAFETKTGERVFVYISSGEAGGIAVLPLGSE